MFEYILLACLVGSFYWYYKGPRNLPPGPAGIPLLGYLPWMIGRQAHLIVTRLQKKYGPLLSFYIGNRLVVILGNYDLIHEAYVTKGDIFSGKPSGSPLEIDGDEQGISVSDGDLWNEQRRFALKTLRDLGVGRQSLEAHIKEEIRYFIRELNSLHGKPSDLHELISKSVSNNICSLEFGRRYDYDDPNFKFIRKTLFQIICGLDAFSIKMFFPWTKNIPGISWLINQTTMRLLKRRMYSFIENMIQEHESQFDTAEHRDLIYAWLDEMNERKTKTHDMGYFTREKLTFNVMSLFLAATEAVASTLLTGIISMVQYPEIQEKCRQEMQEILGNEAYPSTSDRSRLPYTEATLLEIQRVAAVNPLNLVHRAKSTTSLNGHTIPKDAVIMGNIWAVHFDTATWSDPFRFNPERFLNEHGQLFNQEKIIPFSIGKRQCLGSSMAKMEIFLYFTALIQNFSLMAPPTEKFEIRYSGGVVRLPEPFRVCATALDSYNQ